MNAYILLCILIEEDGTFIAEYIIDTNYKVTLSTPTPPVLEIANSKYSEWPLSLPGA